MCSAVNVEWCVLTRAAWVYVVCLLLCKEEGSTPVCFAITERRDMDMYEVSLLMSYWVLGWELC